MSKYLLISIFCLFTYSVNSQGFGAGVDDAMIMEQDNRQEENQEVDAGLEDFKEAASEEFGGEQVPVANIQEAEIDSTVSAKLESSDGFKHFVPVILFSAIAAIAVIVFLNLRKKKS